MRISSVQRWQDADKYDDVDPGDVYDDGAHDDADDVDDKVDTVYQTVVECVFAITPLDPVWIPNVLLIFAKPSWWTQVSFFFKFKWEGPHPLHYKASS